MFKNGFKIKLSTLMWLIRNIGNTKYVILLLALIQTVISAGSILFAMEMRSAIDAAVSKKLTLFWQSFVFMGVIVIVQLSARAALRYLNERSSADIENSLKSRLFGCLLGKEYRKVSGIHSAEWMNRLSSDTSFVAGQMVSIIPETIGMLVKLLGAVAFIIILQPKLAVILLSCGIIALSVTFLLRKRLKLLHKRIREADGSVRVFLQDRLSSMMMLRAYSAEVRTLHEAEKLMHEHKTARLKRNMFSNFANTSLGILMYSFYLLGFVLCCLGIIKGTVSYGTLTAVLQLIGQIQSPLVNLSGVIPNYYSMIASAERLIEAEDYKEELKEIDEDSYVRIEQLKKNFSGISVKNLQFVYSGIDKRGVNIQGELSIRRGEFAAFTGYSGIGKSTLFKILLAFYVPDEGSICLSLSDGESVRVSPELRSIFAYVPQNNQLMSGSIRDIVSYSDPEHSADDRRIWDALNEACATRFVKELPEGLDTVLGERGQGLSEGQLQRLSIARAVFSDAPILLFDESTSALDTETEKRLLENIKQKKDKTVLMIAHRPTALEMCDKIYELKE